MKRNLWFILTLCLALTACARTAPPTSPEESPAQEPAAITVTPIAGETVSPDGKWEVILDGVNEGITSGGLYPSETVKIVARDSGEVLWEDSGAYLLHIAWPEGSEFAVIARTARTRVEVSAVSLLTGESCPVLLPGEEPIPEYTFLAEDWIGWTDENTFELRLDGGDGVGVLSYWCSPVENDPISCSVVQACYETLPGEYDFTHDGQPEKVELVTVVGDDGRTDGELRPIGYELHISNAEGEPLWTGSAHMAHMGWANLFACRIDGKDYILDYSPYMGQGFANYGYRLFSLAEDGEELLLKENGVSFDINFGAPHFTGDYDPAAIGAFMDDVHSYLEGDCDLLISTQDFNTIVFGSGAEFRGDDFTGGELYSYDGTWEERFAWYREQGTQG